MEHSRSCLGKYFDPPVQVVSPHEFGDTFAHPTTGEICGFQKATEVRMRGFARSALAVDPANAAANPKSFANLAFSARHPDGTRLSFAELAELRARSTPGFMAAVAAQTSAASIVVDERPAYSAAVDYALEAHKRLHGDDSTPSGWRFPQGLPPPHSAAARVMHASATGALPAGTSR